MKTLTVDPSLFEDGPACLTINQIIRDHAIARARAWDLFFMQNPAILFRLIWPPKEKR